MIPSKLPYGGHEATGLGGLQSGFHPNCRCCASNSTLLDDNVYTMILHVEINSKLS